MNNSQELGSLFITITFHPQCYPPFRDHIALHRPRRLLATCAEIALQRRNSPGDLIHILCTQSVPMSAIDDTLAAVLLDFEASHSGMAAVWINEAVGLAVEIYR